MAEFPDEAFRRSVAAVGKFVNGYSGGALSPPDHWTMISRSSGFIGKLVYLMPMGIRTFIVFWTASEAMSFSQRLM